MCIWSCDLPHFCVVSCNTLLSACGKMASACSASNYANRRTETKFSLHVSHIQNNMPLGDYYSEERETCTGKLRKRKFFPPWACFTHDIKYKETYGLHPWIELVIRLPCDVHFCHSTLTKTGTDDAYANPPKSYQKHFSLLKLIVQYWESKSVTAAAGPLWW